MVANARKDEPRARSIVAGIELDATADACEPNASALARHCGRSCSCPPADGLAPPLLARTSWWWTQSCETGLCRANSLVTGKITGNCAISGHTSRLFGDEKLRISIACRRNSLLRRTGN